MFISTPRKKEVIFDEIIELFNNDLSYQNKLKLNELMFEYTMACLNLKNITLDYTKSINKHYGEADVNHRRIVLNDRYNKKHSPFQILCSICHELRHIYQSDRLIGTKKFDQKPEKNLPFLDFENFMYPLLKKHRINSRQMYLSSRNEADARLFSNEFLKLMFKQLYNNEKVNKKAKNLLALLERQSIFSLKKETLVIETAKKYVSLHERHITKAIDEILNRFCYNIEWHNIEIMFVDPQLHIHLKLVNNRAITDNLFKILLKQKDLSSLIILMNHQNISISKEQFESFLKANDEVFYELNKKAKELKLTKIKATRPFPTQEIITSLSNWDKHTVENAIKNYYAENKEN